MPQEGHQGDCVLARQCPSSLGTCNPEETGLRPVPGLKEQMKGRHFSSDIEVIAAAETWLDGQPSEFFLIGLQKLEQRAKRCTELRGEYVE